MVPAPARAARARAALARVASSYTTFIRHSPVVPLCGLAGATAAMVKATDRLGAPHEYQSDCDFVLSYLQNNLLFGAIGAVGGAAFGATLPVSLPVVAAWAIYRGRSTAAPTAPAAPPLE